TVTLTARDSGIQETQGGLSVTFGLGAGNGAGTFSNLADNNNGTYTATFTATKTGTIAITATINGQPLTSTLPVVTITQVASHFQLTAPFTAASGTPVGITVTALDQNNNVTDGYTGTVHFTSTDGAAFFSINDVSLTHGSGVVNVIFNTPGAQSISA